MAANGSRSQTSLSLPEMGGQTSGSKKPGSDVAERLWWSLAAPERSKLWFPPAARRITSTGPRLCRRRTSRLCPWRAAPQRASREGLRTWHSPGVPLRCILPPVPDREVSLPPAWPLHCCQWQKRARRRWPAASYPRPPPPYPVLTHACFRPAAQASRSHAC